MAIYTYQRQLFGFGRPIKQILDLTDSLPVHVFWKDLAGKYLGQNYNQVLLCGLTSHNQLIGRKTEDFLLEQDARLIEQNDRLALKKPGVTLFVESGTIIGPSPVRRECVAIKTSLKNAAGRIVGSFGLSFFQDEISWVDSINVLKMLNIDLSLHCLMADDFKIYANNLSPRERECVYYLTKGMTAKEIAKQLLISVRTVETYFASIKNKLHCYRRSEIISKVFG